MLPGSGLSSSAAFEVLIGRILNGLFANNAVSAIEIAQIGQYAENVYYGKPSGLMDQMASSVGGLVFIDFNDPKMPVVEKVDYDFAHSGYTLCTIDAGADHADLTDEYAAIPAEMKQVAKFFGKKVLREVDEKEFYKEIAELRKGNRRPRGAARHPLFQREPSRPASGARTEKRPFRYLPALRQRVRYGVVDAASKRDPGGIHREAGYGVHHCALPAAARRRGAVRIHGGGFAGTALAFVPNDKFDSFKTAVESALGTGHCHPLKIMG